MHPSSLLIRIRSAAGEVSKTAVVQANGTCEVGLKLGVVSSAVLKLSDVRPSAKSPA